MFWKEDAGKGLACLGIAAVSGLFVIYSQRPLAALIGSVVAVGACAAADGHFRNAAKVACRQAPSFEAYCRTLV